MAHATYEEALRIAQELTPEEQDQLIEDLQDAAWARDYEARKAAGQLTPDEQATVPLEQVKADLEVQWAKSDAA